MYIYIYDKRCHNDVPPESKNTVENYFHIIRIILTSKFLVRDNGIMSKFKVVNTVININRMYNSGFSIIKLAFKCVK